MKNKHKIFPIGIIALIAIIGLVLAACSGAGPSDPCAHGHTIEPNFPKVSISLGVFEGTCIVCGNPHAHEFTYNIGDPGPAGGIIFYNSGRIRRQT